jgi:hypothetical protein
MVYQRIVALTILLLSLGVIAEAQPVFDAATSRNIGVVNTDSFTHTATGTNRLAILCLGYGDPTTATITTKTYDGIDMTLVGSVKSPPSLLMYRLIAPPTGVKSIQIDWDAFIQGAVIGVVTFTGVDQTTPLGSFASGNADNSGPATVSVSSAVGELVVDCVYGNDVMNITVGGGQTVRWEQDTGTIVPGGSSTKPGASPNVTMSWTLSSGTDWSIAGVSIKPVAAAGGSSVSRRRF